MQCDSSLRATWQIELAMRRAMLMKKAHCNKTDATADGRKVNCFAMKILLATQSREAFLFHFVLFYFCKVAFLCDLWYLRNASYGMPFTLQLY